MADVYLIAPLGLSPAVVTETLWWLVAREGHTVVGVELWVTESRFGERDALGELRGWVKAGLWEDLMAAAGPARVLLPSLPAAFEAHRVHDRPPGAGLNVFAFGEPRATLGDVRDTSDADVVARQLHARVRFVRRELREGTVLIGSIAGGRKNFGASLHAAFEFHAHGRDRLVHVLLHPKIEAMKDQAERYVAPQHEVLGVAVDDQLTLVDVPFPPLRLLAPEWAPVFDSAEPVTLWAELRRNLRDASELTAELGRKDRRWVLRFFVGAEPRGEHHFDTAGSAELYAAIVAGPCGDEGKNRRFAGWSRWLVANHLSRRPPGPPDDETIARRLRDLTAEMAALRPRGLASFAAEGSMQGVRVAAADRVRLPPGMPRSDGTES